MTRWETRCALAAVIVASVAALPVPGRLWYTGAALVLLAIVGGARIRAALRPKRPAAGFDAAERARSIRDARSRRG